MASTETCDLWPEILKDFWQLQITQGPGFSHYLHVVQNSVTVHQQFRTGWSHCQGLRARLRIPRPRPENGGWSPEVRRSSGHFVGFWWNIFTRNHVFLDVFTMKYMGGPCNFYPSTNPMIIGMEEMHGNAAIHWDLKGVPGSFGNIRWQAIFWYPSLGSMAVLTCDVSGSRVKVRALSSSAFNLQEFLSCSFSWLELVKFQVWSSVWHHHNNKCVIRKNLQ